MIEILLLMVLCKQLRATLRAKGRLRAGWFQFLLVVCWFGGEFVGAAAMVFVDLARGGAGDFRPLTYLGALLGGAGGAAVVFAIAHSLAPLDSPPLAASPVLDPARAGPPSAEPPSAPPPPPPI